MGVMSALKTRYNILEKHAAARIYLSEMIEMDLKTRAQNFLDLPVPFGIDVESDSAAEMFIRNYAEGGDFDDELMEMADQALVSIDETIDAGPTPEAEAYFIECKSVISGILHELGVE